MIIDVGSRAVLGYHLSLNREYSCYDVIRTIEAALEPHCDASNFLRARPAAEAGWEGDPGARSLRALAALRTTPPRVQLTADSMLNFKPRGGGLGVTYRVQS